MGRRCLKADLRGTEGNYLKFSIKFGVLVLVGWLLGTGAARAEVITSIEIKGNRALAEETVRSLIGSKVGDTYSPDRVSDDVRAIYASGFVKDVVVEREFVSGGITLAYTIVEKPIVREVKFEGNKAINEDDLKGIVDIKPRSVYDPAKLAEIKSKLLSEYAKRGHLMARVDIEVRPAGPNQVDLIFKIDEGKKPVVSQVEIYGNEAIDDRKLKQRMVTKAEGPFTAKPYGQEDFLRDLYVLDFYYQDNGYIEAQLSNPEKLLTPDRQNILLGVGVSEGPQYRVGKISVQGDLLVPEADLLKRFQLRPGEIFRRSLFLRDRQFLIDHYGAQGYALAEIEPELKPDREKRIVDIVWHARKGSKVYIQRITITGNAKTYDKVIRRELTLKEGQLYSTYEARRSEARVNQLGYFSEVQIIPRPAAEPNRVNVEVAVKEKRSGSLTAGAGVSTASEYFFSLQYQQQNFLGMGTDLSLQAMVSDHTQTYYIRYADPYFLDSNWHLGVNLFSNEMYQVRFVDQRRGGSITLGRRVPHTDNLRVYAMYAYQVTNLESFMGSSSIYRKQPADSAIGSLTLTLDWNALNNYIDPSDGARLTAEVEIAGQGLFGGNNDFIKTRLEALAFQPVYKGTYLAGRARLRFMDFNDGDNLLISERFFQGGPRSLRGYEVASVSPYFPEDDGDFTPIGGNKDALFTAEFIVPLSLEMGMKAAVFYDLGYVWNDNEDMDLLGGDMLSDWGFGLRWMSPMGPLRFELAFPLEQRKQDDPQQFIFTVGTFF